MNGHVIEGTPIAVDFWKVRECPQVKLFFLSHVHDDHIKGLTPSWRLPIYTSVVSAKLLTHFVKVPVHLVKPLEVGTSHLIPLGEKGEESMTVTLIDARHCPGAVMFLFEGYFGTFLYTGDFRYDHAMADDSVFAAIPTIDRLYMDNTYCSPSCSHPARELVTEKILETIQSHPPNTQVLFGLTRVGKEDLLVKIAQKLKEWIIVSPETYTKMQILEMSDVFTVDDAGSRIRVLPFHILNKSNFQYQKTGDEPFIIILPSSIMGSEFRPPYGPNKNIYSMPYSNHSSFPELTAFVSKIRPRCIIPIVTDKEERTDMSAFDNLLEATPCKPFRTPPCVENWHVTGKGSKPLLTQKRKRTGLPKITKGVSFIDENSSESKLSGRDSDRPKGDVPKSPSKHVRGDSNCDSDYNSDSDIFDILKKLKPQSGCEEGDLRIGNESSISFPPVEDAMSSGTKPGTEISGSNNCTQIESKIDELATAAAISKELVDEQPLPDTNLEPGSNHEILLSKKVCEVDLTLTDSSDKSFNKSTLSVTETLGCQVSASDVSSQKECEMEFTVADSAEKMVTENSDSLPSQDISLELITESLNYSNSASVEAKENVDEVVSSLSDRTLGSDALFFSHTTSEEELNDTTSQEELNVISSQKDLNDTTSQEEINVISSQEEIIVISSQEEIIVISSQEEINDTTSQEELNDSTSQKEPNDTTSQKEPNDTSSQEGLNDTTSQKELNDTTSQEELKDTTSQEELNDTTSQEELNDSTSQKEPNDTTSQKEPNDTTSQEELNDTTSQKELNDTTSLEELNDTTSLEELNDTTSQVELNDTTSQEELNDTTSQEELNDTTSQVELNDTTSQEELNDTISQEELKDTTLRLINPCEPRENKIEETIKKNSLHLHEKENRCDVVMEPGMLVESNSLDNVKPSVDLDLEETEITFKDVVYKPRSGNGDNTKLACGCQEKWKLEETLQKVMAYARGEPFRPFKYPDDHVCLLTVRHGSQ